MRLQMENQNQVEQIAGMRMELDARKRFLNNLRQERDGWKMKAEELE